MPGFALDTIPLANRLAATFIPPTIFVMLSMSVHPSPRQVHRAFSCSHFSTLRMSRKTNFVCLVYFVVQIALRSAPVGYAAEYLIRGKFATLAMNISPLMSINCILYYTTFPFYMLDTAIKVIPHSIVTLWHSILRSFCCLVAPPCQPLPSGR